MKNTQTAHTHVHDQTPIELAAETRSHLIGTFTKKKNTLLTLARFIEINVYKIFVSAKFRMEMLRRLLVDYEMNDFDFIFQKWSLMKPNWKFGNFLSLREDKFVENVL